MKKILLSIALLAGAIPSFAVDITGFGSGDFNVGFASFGNTQTANSLSISGPATASLFGTITQVNIGSPSTLYLTGTLNTTTSAGLEFELVDTNDVSSFYEASLSGIGIGSLVEISLTYNVLKSGLSNGQITSFYINGVGTPLETISASLDKLSTTTAVPEPSTYGLIAGGVMLGYVILRRRKAA